MKLWQCNIWGSNRGRTLSLVADNVWVSITDRFKLNSSKNSKFWKPYYWNKNTLYIHQIKLYRNDFKSSNKDIQNHYFMKFYLNYLYNEILLELPLQWQSASTKSLLVTRFHKVKSAGTHLPDVTSKVNWILVPSWAVAEQPLVRLWFPLPNVIWFPWSSWQLDQAFQFCHWANNWTQLSS